VFLGIDKAVKCALWSLARADLAHRLQRVALHPPKRAIHVSEPLAETYFNLMLVHEKLRAPDFPPRNYLQVTLRNIMTR